MNAVSEKQADARDIFQHGLSPCDGVKSWPRRRPSMEIDEPNVERSEALPSKPYPKLELPHPVTSATKAEPPEAPSIHRKTLLTIAFLCILITCWNIARFTIFLHAIDGRVTGVRVSGRLEEVPKEMREAGSVPWWKVAVVKVEVEVDVDDPPVTKSGLDVSVWEKHPGRRDNEDEAVAID